MNLGAIFGLLQTALLLLSSVQAPGVSEEMKQQAISFSYQIVEIATRELAVLTLPKIDESGIVIAEPIISPQLSGVEQPILPQPPIEIEAQTVHRYGTNWSESSYDTEEPFDYKINSFDRVRFILRSSAISPNTSCFMDGDWSGNVNLVEWVDNIKLEAPGIYNVACVHNGVEIFRDRIDINFY